MRVLAAALSIALWPGCALFAGPLPTAPPAKPAASSTAAPAPPSSAAADAAAARHAKRTACRKQASGKKLLNAPKFEFIKQCMAKP